MNTSAYALIAMKRFIILLMFCRLSLCHIMYVACVCETQHSTAEHSTTQFSAQILRHINMIISEKEKKNHFILFEQFLSIVCRS